MMPINILGSCVTRDAFNFCKVHSINEYLARQTIISLMSDQLPEKYEKRIIIKSKSPVYEYRMYNINIKKDALMRLNPVIPLVLDFVDERYKVCCFSNKFYITYSNYASKNTNLKDICDNFIQPFSSKWEELLNMYIYKFAERLLRYNKIILHKTYFDINYKNYYFDIKTVNFYLDKIYYKLIEFIPNIEVLEMPKELCKHSFTHKWGPDPFHFIDEYYLYFLDKLQDLLNEKYDIDDEFSMQIK